MPLKNAYCTVTRLRGEIKNTDSAVEADLENAINDASRWVDDYHGGDDFYEHDHTSIAYEVLPHMGIVFEDRVFLPFDKIITLGEVKLGDTVLVEGTDFTQGSDGTLYRIGGHWLVTTTALLTIKGKFGYDQDGVETTVPADLPANITLSTMLVAAALSALNKREVSSLEGGTVSMTDRDIPDEVGKMLGPRRKMMV